jgi:hypothetical protein
VVKGLDLFREHFAALSEQYVLIGGTAATLAMAELGLDRHREVARGGDALAICRSLRCTQTAPGQKEGRLPQSRRAAFSQVAMNGGACSAA